MEQDYATTVIAAQQAIQRKIGWLKCPMCESKQPEAHFHAGILQTSDFQTYGVICPKCGYLLQFDLRKLLAE